MSTLQFFIAFLITLSLGVFYTRTYIKVYACTQKGNKKIFLHLAGLLNLGASAVFLLFFIQRIL